MKVIRGIANLPGEHRGCVATIGNFDGVHLGHQTVLGQLAEKAAALELPMVVVLFEPQAQEFFAPDKAPSRLSRFREKIQVLRRFSVDQVLCLRFSRQLASLSPDDFIQRILIDGLRVRYLVVGDDFRFGFKRQGDFNTLLKAGETSGFQVARMPSFHADGVRISSTLIRQALKEGEMNVAEQLLGHPYRMSGRVVYGEGRGRTIGFPTANIRMHRIAVALHGVFVVAVFGLLPEPIYGVANIGHRPTVNGTETLLEVHLFDYDKEIYGRYLQVDFLHKLRGETRFPSFSALKKQIDTDCLMAKQFLQQTVR
ncbi:FMN adenylyltransferase / Riboflavin kinase [hydrothermal vent metagenome]|uniref:Bifunctional riboflavin kinase/FMN adenylyltransferase n=1 Tax=hydrothermal vent metagenome TaxID=652676 RepID=A0A3B0ZHX6_9ZZZZ